MPLYEYECTDCRTRFEIRQRVVEDPISVCPTCGGTTRRLFHPVGIIFKGSGWYSTDSRKSESAPTTGSTEKSGAEKGSSETGTSEKSGAEKPTTEAAKSSPATTSPGASSESGKSGTKKSE